MTAAAAGPSAPAPAAPAPVSVSTAPSPAATAAAGAPAGARRRPRRRPPPLLVPDTPRGGNASSLPANCYEVAQPSLPVPVSWPAEGPPASAATRRGSRRPANEDRVFADARAGVFGVCDGHGGPHAAELAAEELIRSVSLTGPPAGVVDAFAALNGRVLAALPDTKFTGTTVTGVAVVPGRALRVVHLGDCRAILLDAAGVPLPLTVDHHPLRRDELARIRATGGTVLDGRVNGVLAVSRALGDCALREWLSPNPDVIDRPLGPDDHLVVVGSDGFFDFVSGPDLAIALANMSVVKGTTVVPVNLKAAVISLINLAVARGSTDDISLVLVDIRVQPTPET